MLSGLVIQRFDHLAKGPFAKHFQHFISVHQVIV